MANSTCLEARALGRLLINIECRFFATICAQAFGLGPYCILQTFIRRSWEDNIATWTCSTSSCRVGHMASLTSKILATERLDFVGPTAEEHFSRLKKLMRTFVPNYEVVRLVVREVGDFLF